MALTNFGHFTEYCHVSGSDVIFSLGEKRTTIAVLFILA
jgi:hypothetical protein